jgi:thiamine pyrophosphate-dependent acetolactate synthase large subunit-like protein
MLQRRSVIGEVVRGMKASDCVVSALGNISRDLYAVTAGMRERAFYCMGSMGSVTPLALGISLARVERRVFALEGDGSLLMNLGALVTLRRYGSRRVRLIVFDNGCYESTGGQPSQPDGLRLEALCRAAGLPTRVATTVGDVTRFVAAQPRDDRPRVLVAKVDRGAAASRVADPPAVIASRLAAWLSAELTVQPGGGVRSGIPAERRQARRGLAVR